jgi:hypothetical protein
VLQNVTKCVLGKLHAAHHDPVHVEGAGACAVAEEADTKQK